jgi:ornithine decarboxylase
VTCDCEKELEKIKTNMPSCQAVLRIRTDDSAALCQFSIKFGATMNETQHLLERAKDLGVAVVGVSFHVGSGNNDPNAYISAVRNARNVFDYGISLGHEMKLLDIGGGFPGAPPPVDPLTRLPSALSFEEIATSVRPVLAELFASSTVIGEPGRFIAQSTYGMALAVHGVRTVMKPNNVREYQYFLSDGLYGAFNCMFYDHAHPQICVLEPDPEARVHLSTLWGPTCDSLDCLLRLQPFPELDLYEWVFIPDFGAYTMAAGSAFNGFKTKDIKFICTVPLDEMLNKKTSEDGTAVIGNLST